MLAGHFGPRNDFPDGQQLSWHDCAGSEFYYFPVSKQIGQSKIVRM